MFVQRQALQTAADATALAAADELGPASDPACQASPPCLATIDTKVAAFASSYSGKNSGSATLGKCVVSTDTNCYTWPYAHDVSRVEIRLKKAATDRLGGRSRHHGQVQRFGAGGGAGEADDYADTGQGDRDLRVRPQRH